DVAVRAVRVGRARRPAGARRAARVRIAGLLGAPDAGAGAVALSGQRRGHARAGRGHALGAGGVLAARRLAVAHPVAAAGGRALIGALAQRVGPVGPVGAGADAAGHVARSAGAGAGGAAADALFAEARVALGPAAARRADRLLAAAAVLAAVG